MEFLYTYEDFKLDLPLVNVEDARYVVLGVPFDGTTSYRSGARFGPILIRQATINLESYVLDYGIELSEVLIADVGNVSIVSGNSERTVDRVKETIEEIITLNPQAVPVLLGGEHSQTLGAIRALKPKSYIVFDAHLDLRDTYEENPYSHACVARRIAGLGVREAMFGIRSGTREEVEFAREKGIVWIHARDYSFDSFVEVVELLPEPIYLSIDIDVFDVSMVPDTGTPEAGGLSFWDVISAIEWLVENKKVIGFDIMEVAGERLGNPTAVTAAKLLFYFIAAAEKGRKL